jgi:polysaccharide pyruvyl transferase WcaK-like protein
MMVGMRLHSLILATTCGIPCVALSYDPKVASFMHQTGQDDAIWDVEAAEPCSLPALMRAVWEQASERAEKVAERLAPLRAAAGNNATIALCSVENTPLPKTITG